MPSESDIKKADAQARHNIFKFKFDTGIYWDCGGSRKNIYQAWGSDTHTSQSVSLDLPDHSVLKKYRDSRKTNLKVGPRIVLT